ncbi:MAG TPA: CehA/McbA family metallohydrolase [Candidatus Limnocylindrales bacterium]
MIELTGRLTPDDRLGSDYLAIPVEVPAGSGALHVTFAYDDAMSADVRTGGNTIDLGIFGPGSLDFGSPAFRGWSGSERSEVWLAADGATPGYRPGPIEPGTWHVVLGLYQVAPNGASYRLTVDWLPEVPPDVSAALPQLLRPSPSPRPPSQAPAGERWLRGDLHCHTLHSDGADEPATLVAEALRLGLDFLAITDHNTDSHHPHVAAAAGDASIVLLRAEEITTYYGHSNAWGLEGWVDFRNRSGAEMLRSFDAVHRQGGLVSVNHPIGATSPWELGDETAAAADTIEVWNGPWSADERAAIDWWAGLVAKGARPTAVGGSDCHSFRRRKDQPLAGPTTWVRAATRDRDGIVDGLRAGRVVVTGRPETPRPTIAARSGDRSATIGATLDVRRQGAIAVAVEIDGDASGMTVRLLSDRGLEAAGPATGATTFQVESAGRRFVRLELERPDGGLAALTNPIHLREV